MTIYRIKNIKTKKFFSLDYSKKTFWMRFPTETIGNQDNIRKNPNDYIVEQYELKLIAAFDIHGKRITSEEIRVKERIASAGQGALQLDLEDSINEIKNELR